MTRYCDECKHYDYGNGDEPIGQFVCAKGHAPRFYQPRSSTDPDWGYKRKCEDFEQREAKQ